MIKTPDLDTKNRAQSLKGLQVLGITIDVLLTKEQTGGLYSAYKCLVPPEAGPPPHIHEAFDEAFTILHGNLEVFVNGEWSLLEQGDTRFIARGVAHAFRGAGSEPCLFIGIATPGGHENFFYDMDALSNPTREDIFAVLEKNQIVPA